MKHYYTMIASILEYVRDHYIHFGCYPADVEVGGKVYKWDEYWQLIKKEKVHISK